MNGMMERFVVGSATAGSKGQIVLPVNVRNAFDISPGETLIVMSRPGPCGHAIMLMKASELAGMLEHIEETGKRIRSLVRETGRKRPCGKAAPGWR
jgi:AbrB family looped-hinge helix DNA binding protein